MPLASTPDNETIANLLALLVPVSKLLMFAPSPSSHTTHAVCTPPYPKPKST